MFSETSKNTLRQAQYAGTWYEADKPRLANQLSEFLKSAAEQLAVTASTVTTPDNELLAIVSPHAGYIFSGKTAAFSYEKARAANVKRVFILGPSHHVALQGVALPINAKFDTPLGPLDVDSDLIEQLQSYPMFSFQPEVHRVEHSLELQLPLIKKALGDVKIVPLVIGVLQEESEVRLIAEVLKGFIKRGDLVIVSSDFTHYGPRYGYVPFTSNLRENVEKLDREAFEHLSRADLEGFIQFHNRTQDTICGLFPCAVLCALLPEGATGTLLKYSTSQDTLIEDKDNSVSYLAISFNGTAWPDQPDKPKSAAEAIKLSANEKKTLITIARRALESFVRERRVIDPRTEADIILTPLLKQCFGAFVTLYTAQPGSTGRALHPEKELRGCIGSIWPLRPLYATIVDNAIAASSRDPRFPPMTANELKEVSIEISVLTAPRRASSYEDIVVGRDGVIISKHQRQAVFLPQVATEFGWDRDELLMQLCRKADLADNDWREGAYFDLFQSLSIEEL